MKTPNIGDTVVIRGVVTSVHPVISNSAHSYLYYRDKLDNLRSVYIECVDEVIPKPWEPRVGDKLQYLNTLSNVEFRGEVDGKWVLKNSSGGLYVTDTKDNYTPFT